MHLNIGFVGLDPLRPTVELVKCAEECGLDGITSSEHLGFHDGIVPSALYLQNTSKIEVSIVGINDTSRHTGLLAMELASLAEIAGGRFRVQVGTGNAGLVAKIGGANGRPIPRVRSLVRALRALLDGKELRTETESSLFDGFSLKSTDGKNVIPYSGGCMPIDVMAVQPGMMRLAAEVADGVALSGGCSSEYLTDAVRLLESELANLGRDRSTFRITAFTYCIVDANVEKYIDRIRYVLGNYVPEGAAKMMRGVMDGEGYVAAAAQNSEKAARAFISDDVIRKVSIAASNEDEVFAALKRYKNTGVDALTAHLVGPVESRRYAIRCLAEAKTALQ